MRRCYHSLDVSSSRIDPDNLKTSTDALHSGDSNLWLVDMKPTHNSHRVLGKTPSCWESYLNHKSLDLSRNYRAISTGKDAGWAHRDTDPLLAWTKQLRIIITLDPEAGRFLSHPRLYLFIPDMLLISLWPDIMCKECKPSKVIWQRIIDSSDSMLKQSDLRPRRQNISSEDGKEQGEIT